MFDVKGFRRATQTTQLEIAEIIGVSQPVFNRFEQKNHLPDKHINSLIKHYGEHVVRPYIQDGETEIKEGRVISINTGSRNKGANESELIEALRDQIKKMEKEIDFYREIIRGKI